MENQNKGRGHDLKRRSFIKKSLAAADSTELNAIKSSKASQGYTLTSAPYGN